MSATYLNATHACPAWRNNVIGPDGTYEFRNEHWIPCRFVRVGAHDGRTTYHYEDCVFVEQFYTYEPLMVWGV